MRRVIAGIVASGADAGSDRGIRDPDAKKQIPHFVRK